MKSLKTYLLTFLLFIFFNVTAQEKFTLKTTELYILNLPIPPNEIKHNDIFTTWQIDIVNKKITYQKAGKEINNFYFTSYDLNKNSTATNTILHFKNSKEIITLIIKNGNDIKIRLTSDKIPNSNPESYSKIKIYSNYTIDDIAELLGH